MCVVFVAAGVDADDIPLSVASNASSVLDVQSDGDKLKTSSSSGRLDTVTVFL